MLLRLIARSEGIRTANYYSITRAVKLNLNIASDPELSGHGCENRSCTYDSYDRCEEMMTFER